MSDLQSRLDAAVASGNLLESSAQNIAALLASASSPVFTTAVEELLAAGEWKELNDRFFRTLAFGTGGLRGRTIGRVVTTAEIGSPDPFGRPQFPCVGTNAMNTFNVSRAAQGLARYALAAHAASNLPGRPLIVIAHDTRHFSRDFAELVAKVSADLGCDAALFYAPRSTPELSFAVRHLGATAGVVITASHNPPHDNGFKCYFSDGAQVVEPHASAIIAEVNATASDAYAPLPEPRRGTVREIGREVDDAYMLRLASLVLDPSVIAAGRDLKIVFTPLHGTGGAITVPMLARLGFHAATVPEQDRMDGRFPTVKSPNPENAEALTMAVALAEKEGADLVIATDPDCDRMGIAVRAADGQMKLLTGNQTGSLIAWYRIKTMFDLGILTPENRANATIIKTFVTTDLQKAIAARFGIRCVDTLTGFKYIGAKLGKYENALPAEARARYRDLAEPESRALRLAHSTYYVFGGEESYGYSAGDFVRDKDGNGAAVMLAEVAAYAKSKSLTLDALLDEIYAEYGYYLERGHSLTFEGAEGAAQIATLAASYLTSPPPAIAGVKLAALQDFAGKTITDAEGDEIPREKMTIFTLEGGTRIAVRPSGTEPKIKYYLFANRTPAEGERFSPDDLAAIKPAVAEWLDRVWAWLQDDVAARLG